MENNDSGHLIESLLALFKGKAKDEYIKYICNSAKQNSNEITQESIRKNPQKFHDYILEYDNDLKKFTEHYLRFQAYKPTTAWIVENKKEYNIPLSNQDFNVKKLESLQQDTWQVLSHSNTKTLLVKPNKIQQKKLDPQDFPPKVRNALNETLHKSIPHSTLHQIALLFYQQIENDWVSITYSNNSIQIESNKNEIPEEEQKKISITLFDHKTEESSQKFSHMISARKSLYNSEHIQSLPEHIAEHHSDMLLIPYGGTYSLNEIEKVDTEDMRVNSTKIKELKEALQEYYISHQNINTYHAYDLTELQETSHLESDLKNSRKQGGKYCLFVFNPNSDQKIQVEHLIFMYNYMDNKIKVTSINSMYIKEKLYEIIIT